MADKDSDKETEKAEPKKRITLTPSGFRAFGGVMGTPPKSDPKK